MAVTIQIKTDIKKTFAGLNKLQRSQLPFAASRALNDTAKDARTEFIAQWHRSFTVRNKTLPRAMWRTKFSTKRNLTVVLFDRFKKAFVPLQIAGGIKRPFRADMLTIPTRHIKRLASGKISKARRPGRLKNSFRGNPFGRGEGIWQRMRGGKLRLLYNLRPSVKVDKAYDIHRIARKKVRYNFIRHFEKRLRQAVKTAR